MGIGCGSQFPALGINIGDIFYRTDRKITYQYIGGNARTDSSWITLGTSGSLLRPYQAVSDPDFSTWGTLESGYTWFNTTESQLKMWNGSRIIPVIEVDISACVEILTGNRIDTSLGNIGINTTSLGTNAVKVLGIGEGTAPASSPTDISQIWSQNYNETASNRLYSRTEEGNSAPIALLTETGPSYGVAWNETTDSYTRLGRTAGHKIAVTLPNEMLPIQASMRRCILTDVGTVAYYLHPTDSALKVDGSTASVLTGADGQVMVEIPAFYIRYGYVSPVHSWEVSPCPMPGFTIHPAFIKDGVQVANRYIGAYEGVLYDTSITQYVDGLYQTAWSCTFALADSSITANSRTAPFKNLTVGQKLVITGTVSNNATFTVASLVSDTKITVSEALTGETAASTVVATQKDFTATTGDKLSSVSGFAPINFLTRANCRVLASNRGAGWRQLDYSLVSAIQLLFLTEYASFYSQSMIGAGITNVADWSAYNDYNPIARSGNSNAIGNATGNTAGSASAATESTKYMADRGIEQLYGHVWKFVDGININNNIPYITNNAVNWADDTATNYTRPNNILGTPITLINADGYQATLQSISEGFLPLTVGASSSTKITDYYYRSGGWRVALLGGSSDNGTGAGGFCWLLSVSSAYLTRYIGGRLSF